MLSLAETALIEQRTLKHALIIVCFVAIGSLTYGIYIQSEIVILNGIFSLLSLISSYLSFLTSKLIARPADQKFQYGYWHIEPLMHCLSGLLMLIICSYALFNGVVQVLQGGEPVDAVGVLMFSIVSGIVCFSVWLYEQWVLKQINSQLIANDAKEWLSDFGFSAITFIGFIILPFLNEPYYTWWINYADSVMVVLMALIILPIPIQILYRNGKEVLLISDSKAQLNVIVDEIMKDITERYQLKSYSSHVVKSGRSYFIEINILVPDDFPYQSIADQDHLREQIWENIIQHYPLPLEISWFSVCMTAQAKWS